jgi:hypothetical protein
VSTERIPIFHQIDGRDDLPAVVDYTRRGDHRRARALREGFGTACPDCPARFGQTFIGDIYAVVISHPQTCPTWARALRPSS